MIVGFVYFLIVYFIITIVYFMDKYFDTKPITRLYSDEIKIRTPEGYVKISAKYFRKGVDTFK